MLSVINSKNCFFKKFEVFFDVILATTTLILVREGFEPSTSIESG